MDMFVVLTVFTGAGIVFAGFGTILMVRHVHHYSGLWLTVAGLASAVIAGGSAIHQQWQSKYRIWNVRLLGMLVVV